ncbi:hypothetical protein HK405_002731, partial [Cladochytrium tenue]
CTGRVCRQSTLKARLYRPCPRRRRRKTRAGMRRPQRAQRRRVRPLRRRVGRLPHSRILGSRAGRPQTLAPAASLIPSLRWTPRV